MAEIKNKVGIIGAGPAGIACAIQLKRYEIDFILFEKDKPGGLLRNANRVENYPGFPKGISGERLVSLFCKQLSINHIKPLKENVLSIDYAKGLFKIKTQKGTYLTGLLVIASGTKPKELTIPIPANAQSRVFYEVINLKKLKDKKIAIIGGGDTAFDYALSLCAKNEVFILNRSKQTKCLPLLFLRCMKNKKIKYYPLFNLRKLEYKDKKLILHGQNKKTISADGLVVAIGRIHAFDYLDTRLKRKIKILEKEKKLYIIGDMKNALFRQSGIAIGDGIRVAMEIAKNIKENL